MAIHTEQLLLHAQDQAKITAAIEAAEQRTSVQFHVYVEATTRYPEARVRDLFRTAKIIAATHRRHHILVYLLAHERRCYVVTDEALRPLEGTRPWHDVMNMLTIDLLGGKIGQGMADALGRFSHIFAGHFPAKAPEATRQSASAR